MNEVERFDAVIIGSGQSGTPLSRALARAGWKVALIERGRRAERSSCYPLFPSLLSPLRTMVPLQG
jgi:choline dehydrogenase-like flavoprotein